MYRNSFSYGRDYKVADDLPFLSNYEQAVNYLSTRIPYTKGAYKGDKPLGGNRRYNRSLIRQGIDGVVCSLHGSDVVTFRPNGDIVLCHHDYPTIMTMQFMNELCFDFRGTKDAMKVIRKKGKLYMLDSMSAAHLIEQIVVVHADNTVTGGQLEKAHVLNGEKMRELRNKYKEFTTYAAQILSIQSEVTTMDMNGMLAQSLKPEKLSVSISEMRWSRNDLIHNRETFFLKLDDALAEKDEAKRLEEMYPLVVQLAINASKRFWEHGQPQGLRFTGNYRYVCTPKTFATFFYELLRFEFSNDLFDVQEMPKGKVIVDANEKYLQY
jgi:hypothetical protein